MDIYDRDMIALYETVMNLSPAGKDIKEKIKKIVDKHDEEGVVDTAKSVVKMKGYDRQMSGKITSEVKQLFPKSFHTDIIKRPISLPVVGTNINKAFYNQHWTAIVNAHLYTFMISYGPNTAVLVGPREQALAIFNYPIAIIEKAIQWCDEGSELVFNKNKITSNGLDGAEVVNNTLYDKLEKYIKQSFPQVEYKRTAASIIFK